MTAAHVVQHNPAKMQALAEVRDRVRAQVLNKLATAEAAKAGEAKLEALKKSGDAAGLSEPTLVSRAQSRGLPRKVLEAVLAADASKLPAYVGVDAGDGSYVVVRLNKLQDRDPAVIDGARAAQQYAQAWSAAESQAYLAALKARFKAVVKAPSAAASAAQQ